MNDEVDNNDILVELDSLFDTRLPLVYLLSPTIASDISKDSKYITRTKDVFGYISEDIFKPIYNNRNKRLLELATPTELFTLIKEYIITANHINRSMGVEKCITMYINIHPYLLTIDEQNIMSDLIKKTIDVEVTIKLVKMNIEELTPSWVEEYACYLVMYNGLEWLNYHIANQNLANTPLIGTSLLVPSIVSYATKESDITSELYKEFTKQMSTVIRLGFINNKYYSKKE